LRNKWGIPADKIVIGKPAFQAAAANTGYVDPYALGDWLKAYYL